jgi:hypothetical protein
MMIIDFADFVDWLLTTLDFGRYEGSGNSVRYDKCIG